MQKLRFCIGELEEKCSGNEEPSGGRPSFAPPRVVPTKRRRNVVGMLFGNTRRRVGLRGNDSETPQVPSETKDEEARSVEGGGGGGWGGVGGKRKKGEKKGKD